MSMCSSLLYLMRILGNHGIPETSLKGVFRAIVLSRLLHALLHDLVSVSTAADRLRLKAFLRTYGYCDQNAPRAVELFNDANDALFQRVLYTGRIMFSSICSNIVNQLNTPCAPDHMLKSSFKNTKFATTVVF